MVLGPVFQTLYLCVTDYLKTVVREEVYRKNEPKKGYFRSVKRTPVVELWSKYMHLVMCDRLYIKTIFYEGSVSQKRAK
jgi:phage-related holin